MLYVKVFLFVIGYSNCINNLNILTNNGLIYYGSSLVIQCAITGDEETSTTLGLQNSKDNTTFDDMLDLFAWACKYGVNKVNGKIKCNSTSRTYVVNIPLGQFVESGQWWRCKALVGESQLTSIAAQVRTIVSVQSMSVGSLSLIELNEGETKDVECVSNPASRPRTEIKWFITRKGEITTGLSNPVYTESSTNFTLTETKLRLTYTGNRTDNGNSLFCVGYQLSTEVTSSNITLNIKYQPSSSLVLSVIPSGMLLTGTSVSVNCSLTGGNPLASLNLLCDGTTGSNFNTETTAISMLVFTVQASNNGELCECTATHEVNGFSKKLEKKIEVQYAPPQLPMITQSHPHTDYVIVDTNVTLTCEVSGGNPLAVLSWDCGSVVNNNTASDKASYSVSFQVGKNDNGRICTCFGTHPYPGYNTSVQHKLIVYYAPETDLIITQYPNGPVDVDDEVTLVCNVTGGNPLAVLSWNCSITINNTSGNTSSYSAKLHVDKNDNGKQCECSAEHPVQSYRPTMQTVLTVFYPPSTPSLMIYPALPLFEGNNTVVTCSVDDMGNPQSNITWIWNQTNVHTFSPDTFEIGPMEKRDNGAVVSCRVSNEYSNRKNIDIQVNKSINVEYYPLVILKDQLITFEEGKTVNVKCTVLGNPTPVGQWFREGEKHVFIKGGPELNMTIFNVTRQKQGRYYCKANSTSKRYGDLTNSSHIDLIIHYPPDVSIDYILNNKSERQVTYICNATGNPNNYTYTGWKHTYYGIDIRTSKQLSSLIQDNSKKLVLSQISFQDSGNYTCFVNNGVPDRNGELQQFGMEQLDIEGSPELFDMLPADDTYSTRKGGNITVSLRFFTFPNITEAFWYRNSSNSLINTKVEDGISSSFARTSIETTFHDVKVNISNYAYHTLLNFTTLDEEMEGAYTLVLKNGFKDKNVTIFVVISSKPDDPTDFNVTKTTSKGMTLSWNRGYSGGHTQVFVIIVFDSSGFRLNQTVPDNYTMTTQTFTISELNPSTKYVLHLYSKNVIGNSTVVKINTTTDSAANVSRPTTKEFPVGAVVGILTGVIFAVLVIIGTIYIKRRCSSLKKDPESTGRKKLTTINKEDEEDDGLKDNILYESAGQGYIPKPGTSLDEYAVVIKNKEKFRLDGDRNIKETALYAEVVKNSKTTKKGDICTNDVRSKRLKKKQKGTTHECREDVYENIAGRMEKEEANYPEKDKRNKDGLVYAELVFNPSSNGPKFVHGIDDRTIYADVDTTQKIDPLPSSDDEETTEKNATKVSNNE